MLVRDADGDDRVRRALEAGPQREPGQSAAPMSELPGELAQPPLHDCGRCFDTGAVAAKNAEGPTVVMAGKQSVRQRRSDHQPHALPGGELAQTLSSLQDGCRQKTVDLSPDDIWLNLLDQPEKTPHALEAVSACGAPKTDCPNLAQIAHGVHLRYNGPQIPVPGSEVVGVQDVHGEILLVKILKRLLQLVADPWPGIRMYSGTAESPHFANDVNLVRSVLPKHLSDQTFGVATALSICGIHEPSAQFDRPAQPRTI